MVNIIKQVDKVLEKILQAALILLVVAMVGFTAWQVLCRYVLLISVAYAEELARLAIVWCIYLGAALGVRHHEHMNVTALIDKFPRWLRMILQVMAYLLIMLFGGVLFYFGFEHIGVMANDFTTSLGYPRYWFFVPNIVGGGLMFVYATANLIIYLMDYFRPNKEKEA